MAGDPLYDVFLSYNSLDHIQVERVANALKSRQRSAFVDRWYLSPGHDWVVAREQALQSSRAVAIFLGPNPMGPWQQRERAWALDQLAGRNDFPVIPVLLPGCEPPLGFLKQLMWIDLRNEADHEVALDKLAAAIRGESVDRNGLQPQNLICPYRGLFAFREEDASFFFGRDVYKQKLIDLVEKQSFVAVIGASGSGKSSLVSAGLVPHLRTFGKGPVWDVVRMVPHLDPLYSLASALVPLSDPHLSHTPLEEELHKFARDLEQVDPVVPLWGRVNAVLRQQPGTTRLLLFVDQWEELYTSCENPQRRMRFVQELLAATSRKDSPLSVVMTVRGDFYTEILQDRQLLDRISNSHLDLGPMNVDELRAIIEGPASNVGLTFQEGLVDRILAEAGAEQGNLPLLEFALEELWKRRTVSQMTHAGYENLGRQEASQGAALQAETGGPLSRAIATYAEEVYGELPQDEQQACPLLFRKLVRAGSRSENDTRRRIPLSELDETSRRVARHLADKRLLITSGAGGGGEGSLDLTAEVTDAGPSDAAASQGVPSGMTVEVAHEELLRRWGRLKGWVNQDRRFLLWRTQLELKLDEWQRDGAAALLRGSALRNAREFYPARQEDLGPDQRTYLHRSLAVEKSRKRNQWLLVSAGVLLLGSGWFSYQQIQRKNDLDKLVNKIANSSGKWTANPIQDLLDKKYPTRQVIAELEKQAQVVSAAANERGEQSLAYAFAAFGQGDVEKLCSYIETANADEVDNLVTALGHVSERALPRLHELADQATLAAKSNTPAVPPKEGETRIYAPMNQQWQWKCRLAVIGLHLGDATIASDMCQIQDRPDPIERTLFIDRFPDWHGDLGKLLKQAKNAEDVPLRSALACGVGAIKKESLRADFKSLWVALFEDWYVAADASVLHSSAGYALRQWGVPEPELKKSEPGLPRAKESWFRNSQGITMLKIEPGMFVRKDSPGSEFVEQSVTLSQAYYLSDREITVLQFRQFVNDRDYPDSEKPQGWIGAQKNYSPGEGYPVQQVRWYDAVLYCNWLSKQNGRDPAYVRTGEKEKVAGEEWDTWELVPHGTGYRLPTEAEWEFGCRSGTTTFYSSGNQEVLSRKYGTWMPLSENQATLSGAKLPNGYGLFDMHGNVLEWCHDWHDDYGGQAVVDPIGAKTGSGRVSRGGCWSSGASNCRSAIRFWSTPDLRNSSLGFRVAAVPSSE